MRPRRHDFEPPVHDFELLFGGDDDDGMSCGQERGFNICRLNPKA